jgi:transmembrane sensor
MEENRFYILCARKLSAELTEAEYSELEMIFVAHPIYQEIYNKLQQKISQVKNSTPINEQEVLDTLRTKLHSDPDFTTPSAPANGQNRFITKSYWNKKYLGIYFMVGFLLASCLLYILPSAKDQTPGYKEVLSQNNIRTKPGSKSQVTLPDGSTVILNADSKLSYPDNFMGNSREVALEGEAFFEITENKKKPFIIHSKNMDIKVLGTVFNVRAYPTETLSEASLISGSIEVLLKNRPNEKILLKPNEKISITHNPGVKQKGLASSKILNENPPLISINKLKLDEADNQVNEIAWTQDKLIFKNENLEDIVQLLERWYGVSIVIESKKLKTEIFTGRFYSESINQVLKALQLTHKFNYNNNNGHIVIY